MAANQYGAIVVGAGHNGLVAASYLARDGLSVLVLERRDVIGGACTTEEFAPGFRGPYCASGLLHLQPKVIDDLKLREHGFEMAHVSSGTPYTGGIRKQGGPRGVHLFPDGTYLGGPEIQDESDRVAQIRQFSEHDARTYFDWVSFWREAVEILKPYFLTEPPTLAELMATVRGTRREEVLERLLTWSNIDMVEHYFEDERVRASMVGMGGAEGGPGTPGSPLSMAIFSCSNDRTRDEDCGTPKGNMGAITDAMERSAKSLGVEVRTGAPVSQVIVEDGTAKGVRLDDGEEIRSSLVVSNADPKRTFSTLFGPGDIDDETLKRVKRLKTRASSLKVLAAISELPDLSRYLGNGYDRESVSGFRTLPSTAYYQQSWDDAAAGIPTRYPLLGGGIPTLFDRSLVQGEGHVFATWITWAAPHLKEGTWADVKQEVGERLKDVITEYVPNFRDSLLHWWMETPEDRETRVGMTDGNIRHLDMIPSQLLSQRQPYRTSVKNFYMCGCGTHPMGEVTGAPGHNAAHAILKDLQRVAV